MKTGAKIIGLLCLLAMPWLAEAQTLQRANCTPPYGGAGNVHGNNYNVEATTQAFGCGMLGIAVARGTPGDDFDRLCALFAQTVDIQEVTRNINGQLSTGALEPGQAVGTLVAHLLNRLNFFREIRGGAQAGFTWILQPDGKKYSLDRRGYRTNFRTRDASEDSAVLFVGRNGLVQNFGSARFNNSTLVGVTVQELQNRANNGGVQSSADLARNAILVWLNGANRSACAGM